MIGGTVIVINDDKSLTMLLRKPRSRWYRLCCIGSKRHYRKDGSCKHIDELLANVKPEYHPRIRVDGWGGASSSAGDA